MQLLASGAIRGGEIQVSRKVGAGSVFAVAVSIATSADSDDCLNDFLCHSLHETEIRVTINKDLDLGNGGDQLGSATPNNLAILRQQIALLDRSRVTDFHQATLEGDLDLMLALVEVIRSQQPDLAQAIAALASRFQYVQLLTLTQPILAQPIDPLESSP